MLRYILIRVNISLKRGFRSGKVGLREEGCLWLE